jgi:hypothetical protein
MNIIFVETFKCNETYYISEGKNMKKNNIGTLKAILAMLIAGMFLITIIPVNASNQNISNELQLPYYQPIIDSKSLQNNESALVCPRSALFYVVPPIAARFTGKPYKLVRNWIGKHFPNTTIMFFGSICSIRPRIGIQYNIYSNSEDPPKKVEVICDNETIATLKGISIPNFSLTYYPFYYTKKGFHHLKFIPDGNESACLNIDFQVGFNGFSKNILPYLGL